MLSNFSECLPTLEFCQSIRCQVGVQANVTEVGLIVCLALQKCKRSSLTFVQRERNPTRKETEKREERESEGKEAHSTQSPREGGVSSS
jgi:hypothetical protein